jgi:hypothetical protein
VIECASIMCEWPLCVRIQHQPPLLISVTQVYEPSPLADAWESRCEPCFSVGAREFGGYRVVGSGKLHHWVNTYNEDFHEYWPATTRDWNALTDENYAL